MPPLSVEVVTSLSPPAPDNFYDVLISRDLVINDTEHWQLATETLVCVAAPCLQREFASKAVDSWPFLSAKSRPDALAA
jgi:LysR family transcriptional regulator, glycine cleavage system transcriptional activator